MALWWRTTDAQRQPEADQRHGGPDARPIRAPSLVPAHAVRRFACLRISRDRHRSAALVPASFATHRAGALVHRAPGKTRRPSQLSYQTARDGRRNDKVNHQANRINGLHCEIVKVFRVNGTVEMRAVSLREREPQVDPASVNDSGGRDPLLTSGPSATRPGEMPSRQSPPAISA